MFTHTCTVIVYGILDLIENLFLNYIITYIYFKFDIFIFYIYLFYFLYIIIFYAFLNTFFKNCVYDMCYFEIPIIFI